MSDHYLYDHESKPRLVRSYEKVLGETALFLEAHTESLVQKWVESYLSAFGRKSFFSPERVQKIFGEMSRLFISCLKTSDFNLYFERLKQKGKLFSELGVPFEEVILCHQLFEESYLSILLQNQKMSKQTTEEIVLAFEEFSHISSALFAASYFRTLKHGWQSTSDGYREESERLRRELQSLHEEFFTSTRNNLASMELMISGINKKLRKTVVQSRRLQIFSELLEKEPHFKNLIKIADKFFKQVVPAGTELIFGFFDEDQRKITIYSSMGAAGRSDDSIPVIDEIFFSQLPVEYQEALFSDSRAYLNFQDPGRLPQFLASFPSVKAMGDYLFLSLNKYHDALGFLFFASPQGGEFGKVSIRYYQRLARVFGNALFSQVYFDRHKKHSNFISIMDQLEERVVQRNSLETTVDFCLGAMIDLLDVERASLMLLDKGKMTLSLYAAKGYRVYPFSGLVLRWGEGIAGWSVKESKIISIPRMKSDQARSFLEKVVPSSETSPQLQVRSLLCVPLVRSNAPIGVINLSTLSYYKNFEQSEIDMINQLAQRVSLALTSLATVKDIESYIKPHLSSRG